MVVPVVVVVCQCEWGATFCGLGAFCRQGASAKEVRVVDVGFVAAAAAFVVIVGHGGVSGMGGGVDVVVANALARLLRRWAFAPLSLPM